MNTKLLIIFYLLNSIYPTKEMSDELKKLLYGYNSPIYTSPFLLSENGILDYYKFMNLKFTDPESLETLNNYKPNTNLNGRLDIEHLKTAHRQGKLDFGITAKPKFSNNQKQNDLLKFAEGLSSDSEEEQTSKKNKKTTSNSEEFQELEKTLNNAEKLKLSIETGYSDSTLNDSIIRTNTDLENEDLDLSLPDIFDENSDEDLKNERIEFERNQNVGGKNSFAKKKEHKEISEENEFVERKSFHKRKVRKDVNDSDEDFELFNGKGSVVKTVPTSFSESEEEIQYNLVELDKKNDFEDPKEEKSEKNEEKVFREVVIVEIMDCKDCLDDPDLVFFTENY